MPSHIGPQRGPRSPEPPVARTTGWRPTARWHRVVNGIGGLLLALLAYGVITLILALWGRA